MAGTIAKYFATSLAIEKVVIEPRVIRSCLPIAMTSSSLVGSESRSTMLAASLAADVPLFIASPTSAWASAGASFVPSPVIATRWPSACSSRMNRILSSGLASAMKSSTPASRAMVAAVRGLSPVTMTVRMPILRNSAKRSTRPSLTVSLSSMRPTTRPSSRIARGVAPRSARWSDASRISGGIGPSRSWAIASMAPLRTSPPETSLDAARAGLGAERDLLGDGGREAAKPGSSRVPAGAPSAARRSRASVDDRAPLGRLVADRRHERGRQGLGLRDAGRRR